VTPAPLRDRPATPAYLVVEIRHAPRRSSTDLATEGVEGLVEHQ
jgi:hypothetical protein